MMNIILKLGEYEEGVLSLLQCSLSLSASASAATADAEISCDSSENDETDGDAEENHERALEEHVSDSHKLRYEERRDIGNSRNYSVYGCGECYWVSHFNLPLYVQCVPIRRNLPTTLRRIIQTVRPMKKTKGLLKSMSAIPTKASTKKSITSSMESKSSDKDAVNAVMYFSPHVCVTHLIRRKGLRINSRMKRNPSNIIIISADAINSSPTMPSEAGSPRRVDSA